MLPPTADHHALSFYLLLTNRLIACWTLSSFEMLSFSWSFTQETRFSATMMPIARSMLDRTADNCVTTSEQFFPSSIMARMPRICPSARLMRLIIFLLYWFTQLHPSRPKCLPLRSLLCSPLKQDIGTLPLSAHRLGT